MDKLTATQVRPKIERDPKVAGLHIKHSSKDSSWFLYYRTKAGKERRPKLGSCSILNRTQAREMAYKILRDVALGEDPSSNSQVNVVAASRTIKALKDEYVRLHASIEIKETTRSGEESLWRKHIIPHFGADRLVADITRVEIIGLKSKMRLTPVTANRTLALLSHAFNLCEEWEWRPMQSNPVYKVKRYKETPRRRMPSLDEGRRLMEAMRAWQDEQPWFIGMILLLCFTGARKGEIMRSRREWWQDDQLVLPDSKTGAKIIPINRQAQAIYQAIPEVKGNPYLIVGRRHGQHLISPAKLWKQLCQDANISELNMHDLRRFFASVAVSSGRSLEQAMQLMGHTQAQTTKRYAFLMTPEKIEAMQATGDQMIKITALTQQ